MNRVDGLSFRSNPDLLHIYIYFFYGFPDQAFFFFLFLKFSILPLGLDYFGYNVGRVGLVHDALIRRNPISKILRQIINHSSSRMTQRGVTQQK